MLASLFLSAFAFAAPRVTPTFAYDWRTETGAATVVNVLDPAVLAALEGNGFSLGEVLGGAPGTKAEELYRENAFYRSVADTVEQPLPHDPRTDQFLADIPPGKGDIPELVRLLRNFEDQGKRSDKDTKGGFFIRTLANNSNYPYSVEADGDEPRTFDGRWLSSPFAFLKLIAVVNRIDRRDFDTATCGSVRFLYRLAYHAEQSSSTMPFFLNVVRTYPKRGDCSEFAKRWLVPASVSAAFRKGGAEAVADYFRAGPLKDLVFQQVELNLQSLRFTSGYMHDFGGQAMYIQRIFRPAGKTLAPVPLENTPDVLAVEKDPSLLTRFVDFLVKDDNLRKLDDGNLVIDFDERFLARQSISWSTLGRARLANKPFSQLFLGREELLNKIDLSKLKWVRSRQGLLERLDNLSCMGCHQAGGTAGFHVLGYATDMFSHGFNRQMLPLSPHAYAEGARRVAYVSAVAAGKEPNLFRPLSAFGSADWSRALPAFEPLGPGQLCVSRAGDFASAPACGQHLACSETVGTQGHPAAFGECVPAGEKIRAGEACWRGVLKEAGAPPADRGPAPSYNFFAFRDKWKLTGAIHEHLGAYRCVLPQSGAPLGRSSRPCTVNEENFPTVDPAHIPAELCANQGGNGFDLCAASGDSGACLESRVVRAMLDTCYPGRFCREDYICQQFPAYQKISPSFYGKLKEGKRVNSSEPGKIHGENIAAVTEQEIGFCVPTYFLFNMRADGHPSPVTGKPPGPPAVNPRLPVRGYK